MLASLKCNTVLIICLLPMLKAATKEDCSFKPKDKAQGRGCRIHAKVLIQHFFDKGSKQCKTKYSCYKGIIPVRQRPFQSKAECMAICTAPGSPTAPAPKNEAP